MRTISPTPAVFLCLCLIAPPALAQAPALPPESELEPGVTFRVYQAGGPLERIAEPVPGVTPNVDERRDVIDYATGGFGLDDRFVAVVTGYLRVERAGVHAFRLTSDDGSMLMIDGQRVVWNRGLHAAMPVDGSIELGAGLHTLKVLYFENAGDEVLSLAWRPPGVSGGGGFAVVPSAHLRTERGVTRVVSPGVKKLASDIEGLRPGDGIALKGVHPSWRIETIHPDGFDPMVGCMAMLPDGGGGGGRLVIGTFEPKNNGVRLAEPNGRLWALSNLDARDPNDIVVEPFAEGFYHPLGMCVVDGDLYVAQRDEITRLWDGDGDGTFESRERFAHGWTSDNYHHFTFGLKEHEGFLYATLSTSIGAAGDDILSGEIVGSNGPNPAGRGTLLKVSLDHRTVEVVCGGFRTPNGVLVLPDGKVLVGENQGAWMPASKINHAQPVRFYGHYNETRVKTSRYPEGGEPATFHELPPTPPALWLPQNEICNSPTSMLHIPDGPFAGQMYIGELKLGGIRRACLEEVNGVLQGAVFRHTQGFEGGVNRLMWGEGGSIYVGCIGELDTWSWRGTRTGLQRLVPTGDDATFEMHSVSATAGGFEVRFTHPADAEALADPARYEIRQWRYVPGPEYGGPKVDEEELTVERVEAESDGRSVRLHIAGLRPGRCVYLRADVPSTKGEPIWSPEAWYTLNEMPGERPAPVVNRADELSVLVFSKTAGYRHASIPDGITMMRRLGREHGFKVEATEDASAFTDAGLAPFDVVCFLSTSGDVLNLAQEAAMQRFIRRGGGYVGIHAAADTEYEWAWYAGLVGAQFRRHPPVQEGRIMIVQPGHPATRALGEEWTHTDEWYEFRDQPDEDILDVLMRVDESSYEGGGMGANHPISWSHVYDGGRAFYTALGHPKEAFTDPRFEAHVLGGVRWAGGLDEE